MLEQFCGLNMIQILPWNTHDVKQVKSAAADRPTGNFSSRSQVGVIYLLVLVPDSNRFGPNCARFTRSIYGLDEFLSRQIEVHDDQSSP